MLASGGIYGLASSSLSVMSGSKAEAKRAALKPTRQSMALVQNLNPYRFCRVPDSEE